MLTALGFLQPRTYTHPSSPCLISSTNLAYPKLCCVSSCKAEIILAEVALDIFFHVRPRHAAKSHYPCLSKVILCGIINSFLAEYYISTSLRYSIRYLAQKLFFCIQKALELLRTRYGYFGFPLRAPLFPREYQQEQFLLLQPF